MAQPPPPATVAAFKDQFQRDFPYGTGLESVRDSDIQRGMNMATTVFNGDLFDTTLVGIAPNQTSESLMAFLYASAHFLVSAVQAAGGLGVLSPARGTVSQGEGTTTGKGAGGVNVSYSWPDFVQNNGALFQFTTTPYGVQYLQLLILKMVGNVGVVAGYNDVSPDSDVTIV